VSIFRREIADLTGQNNSNGGPLPAGTVLIVTPGGLEHGGGIGRQMGYFLRAYHADPEGLRYRIVDSRGPWFIGASPIYSCGALMYLGHAVLALLFARCTSTPCVAHVNITGRGSTLRKVVLLTVARRLGLRYILHLHDYDYADYYRSRGTFLKKRIATVFRRAAMVVVLGRRDQEVISQLLDLPRDRIIVLHNAVPDPVPDLAKTHPPGEPCHLLFLGYLSARKGVPELLRALAGLPTTTRRWRATLAGGGPIDEYRRFAEDLGILDRLCFPGWLDEAGVRTLCAEADVLVLPSHAEGLAMSVLEGLSHGLAVIATPVGAHAEVIEPEVSGLFIPPGDVTALADALARVIDDESLRKRLAKGARERFLAAFDVRGYAARLAQLHAGLLGYRRDEPKAIGEGQRS
jgi:glycosyltransferase involved in cell wall biosynthesis